jgi:hypothetical protein
MELRMSYLEARPMLVLNTQAEYDEKEEDDEQRVMTYEPSQSEENVLPPEEFESRLTPSKLKKLTVDKLSQIAQEKNINITDSEGKRLKKNSIIDKITSTADKKMFSSLNDILPKWAMAGIATGHLHRFRPPNGEEFTDSPHPN